MWVCIRDHKNKMLCRYDPNRRLLEFVRRGEKTVIDLDECGQADSLKRAVDSVQEPCYTLT